MNISHRWALSYFESIRFVDIDSSERNQATTMYIFSLNVMLLAIALTLICVDAPSNV